MGVPWWRTPLAWNRSGCSSRCRSRCALGQCVAKGRGCSVALIGDKSPSLTMSAVSRRFQTTLQRALKEERHFALVDRFCALQPGLAFNRWGSGTQSDPAISSITTCDHDYLFELPSKRERDAQSYVQKKADVFSGS